MKDIRNTDRVKRNIREESMAAIRLMYIRESGIDLIFRSMSEKSVHVLQPSSAHTILSRLSVFSFINELIILNMSLMSAYSSLYL